MKSNRGLVAIAGSVLGKKIRYLMTGGSSAFIEYSSFVLLERAVHVPLIASNIISFVVGFLVSFLMHKQWTFSGDHNRHPIQQLTLYGTLAAINVVLSSVIIGLVVDMGVSSIIAKMLSMAMIVVWNYIILNKIIFSHKKTFEN